MTQTARLKIGVIGDDVAGLVLAKAWAGSGHEVVSIFVETEFAAERADSFLPGAKLADMSKTAQASDLLLFALPADRIENSVSGLAELGLLGPRKIVVHISPEHGYAVLASAARTGSIPIALTPLMTFTGTSMDLISLRSALVAVTSPEVLIPIAQALAIELGAEPIVIQESQRPAFREAIAVASDFSALVIRQALGILTEAEVERPGDLIGPVVRAAVEDALRQGASRINPEDAL